MKAITFLNDLVASQPVMEVLDKITNFIYLHELSTILKDNDDLLSELASWLENDNYPLSEELWRIRLPLLDLREAYRATYGQNT